MFRTDQRTSMLEDDEANAEYVDDVNDPDEFLVNLGSGTCISVLSSRA